MKKILLLCVVVIIVAIWQLCPTEKCKFKRDIVRLERAAEAENADEIVNYIHPSYQDSSGMTYDEMLRVFTEFFSQVDSINIQMSGLKLSIDSLDKDHATLASCSLGLRVLARYEGERVLIFGGIVHPASVRAFFRKTGKNYMLYLAEY